jgi:hypothetical protein
MRTMIIQVIVLVDTYVMRDMRVWLQLLVKRRVAQLVLHSGICCPPLRETLSCLFVVIRQICNRQSASTMAMRVGVDGTTSAVRAFQSHVFLREYKSRMAID